MPAAPGGSAEEVVQVPSVPQPKSKPAMFTPAKLTLPLLEPEAAFAGVAAAGVEAAAAAALVEGAAAAALLEEAATEPPGRH